MARKSSRLTAKRGTITQLQSHTGGISLAATTTKGAALAPPKKKQKPATMPAQVLRAVDYRKIRGKRGILKNIIGMPLDILMEILGQLQPIDILNVSRVSKELRAIVADSSANFLWRKVYANASEPAPPFCLPEMNVLQYTNLLYGRNCHFCSSVRGIVVHYGARVRMCVECAPIHLIRLPKNPDPAARLCVSISLETNRALALGTCILREEFEHHKRALESFKNKENKLMYTKTRDDHNKPLYELSRQLVTWNHDRKIKEDLIAQEICRRRHDAILSKLTALGYGEEIAKRRYPLERLRGVSLTKELTDKGWENIKNSLVAIYELQRQEDMKLDMISRFKTRIQDILVPTVVAFIKNSPKPSVTAPYSNIVRSEPFCSLMKTYGPDVDELEIARQIRSLKPCIANILQDWQVKADNFLLGLINHEQESHMASELDKRPLELAITFFKCHWCAEALSYPRVLMHSCVRGRIFREQDDEDFEVKDIARDKGSTHVNEDGNKLEGDSEDASDSTKAHGIPKNTPEGVWAKMSSWYGSTWNEGSDQITVDEEATNSAKAIVEACGEDPNTLTSEAMEELDVRIECKRCSIAASKKPRNRLVMTWRLAILHEMERHYEEPPTADGWRLVNDDTDLATIREAEEKASSRSRMVSCQCRHCNLNLSTRRMEAHLSAKHSIHETNAKALKKHFYMDLDSPMKMPPYPVKIATRSPNLSD